MSESAYRGKLARIAAGAALAGLLSVPGIALGQSLKEQIVGAWQQVSIYNEEGGGWCDWCGCWMRHGCDPNGNCNIGHAQVCGPDSCVLHPQGPCYSSGVDTGGGHT